MYNTNKICQIGEEMNTNLFIKLQVIVRNKI